MLLTHSPHPPTPPPPLKIRFGFFVQNQLTRELRIRVIVFVLKTLLTYFEMLVNSHALHCVDGCCLYFILFDRVAYYFGFSTRPRPTPPHCRPTHFFRFRFFCLNSLTIELKIRVIGFVLKKLLTYFEI